jgi:hypothetical protein
LAASVTLKSMPFHRRIRSISMFFCGTMAAAPEDISGIIRATVAKNVMTVWQPLDLICSMIAVSRCMRRRQYSTSESGPASLLSHRTRSLSSKYLRQVARE